MEREPDGTLVTLLDEDGNEKEFEHLATIEHEGTTYVGLIPAFMEAEQLVENDGELIILKMVEDENGDDILSSIDDDDEFNVVSHEFEEMLENDYDIIGEDEDRLDEDAESLEDDILDDEDDGDNDGSADES